MKEIIKEIIQKISITACIAILIFISITGLSFYGLWHYKTFAPKKEAIRRDVFKQTRSYNEAKIQELAKYRLEYIREKDPVSKEAIKSTIILMFSDYNVDLLPAELKSFIHGLYRDL